MDKTVKDQHQLGTVPVHKRNKFRGKKKDSQETTRDRKLNNVYRNTLRRVRKATENKPYDTTL
jgi:hypothetical protein